MEGSFRLHVYPLLGDLQMGAVRQSHIRNWVKDRSAVLAPTTLRLIFTNLNTLFLAAVLDKARGDNPCAGVRLPEIEHEEMVIPTPDQVHAVADALPLRYRALPYLVAGTGLRPGEALGLELEHAAFLPREIRVAQQLITIAGRAPFLTRVKTKTSKRTAEMPAIVSVALAEHIRLFPPQAVEVDDDTDPRKPVRRMATLLFPNEDGRPVHRSNWSRIFGPAVRSIGLPKGTGLHALRHYFASLTHRERREREDGTDGARPRHADDHAQHVRAPVAGRGGPDPVAGRRRARHGARDRRAEGGLTMAGSTRVVPTVYRTIMEGPSRLVRRPDGSGGAGEPLTSGGSPDGALTWRSLSRSITENRAIAPVFSVPDLYPPIFRAAPSGLDARLPADLPYPLAGVAGRLHDLALPHAGPGGGDDRGGQPRPYRVERRALARWYSRAVFSSWSTRAVFTTGMAKQDGQTT